MILVLMGFMGAGKTTIGYLLAEKLGLPFVDIDILIEHRTRRRVREIFAADGEVAFRRMEHQSLMEVLAGPDAVVALGGGAVEHPGTRAALKAVTSVHLEVSYEEAVLRIGNDNLRPMMSRPDIGEIYQRRQPIYREAAQMSVRTDRRRPEDIVVDLLEAVVAPETIDPGVRSVLVAPMGGAHQVHVGAGIAGTLPSLLPKLVVPRRSFVLSENAERDTVAMLCKQMRAGGAMEAYEFVVTGKEPLNRFGAAEEVSEWLAREEAGAGDLLVGVGGENLCYLAGFVSATYNRGMPLALIPTTLHAQADAAVGGKNGVRLATGDNLAGTIHQPLVVIDDVELALGNRESGFRSGLAEIAKHAVIADPAFLATLTAQAAHIGDRDVLVDVLARSTMLKAAIVALDQREQGERIALRYGHTFGRAFERLMEPGPDRHGDAVALGMVVAGFLAVHLGRISRDVVDGYSETLRRLGLPTRATYSLKEVRAAWRDSRRAGATTEFVLLNGAGVAEGRVRADDVDIAAALADLESGS